jgi:hypothetical protein
LSKDFANAAGQLNHQQALNYSAALVDVLISNLNVYNPIWRFSRGFAR